MLVHYMYIILHYYYIICNHVNIKIIIFVQHNESRWVIIFKKSTLHFLFRFDA